MSFNSFAKAFTGQFPVGFACGAVVALLTVSLSRWNPKLSVACNILDIYLSSKRPSYQIQKGDMGSIRKERIALEKIASLMGSKVPMKSETKHMLKSESGHEIPVHIYKSENCPPDCPLVVFLHGGGFTKGSTKMYEPLITAIADGTKSIVMSVDYRLAPENPFPAAPKDCIEATEWAHAHAQELGANPNKLVIIGDSAGGNLAIIVSLQLSNIVKLSIPIYPVTQFGVLSESKLRNYDAPFLKALHLDWYNMHYFDKMKDIFHPLASPFARSDLKSAPRTHIITADTDVLCDEGISYRDALLEASCASRVTYKNYIGAIHGFVGISMLTHGTAAVSDICDVVNNHFY